MKEPDKCALQNSIKDLDDAYKNFFRRVKNGEKSGFPKFKSKHNHRQSYRTNCNIRVFENAVQMPLGIGSVNKKTVGFYHGALTDSYEEQANAQGFTLGERARLFEDIAYAYNTLRIEGYLTDKQADAICKKIQKNLVKNLQLLQRSES